MKKLVLLILVMGLSLVGCSQDAPNSNNEINLSTKERIYSKAWDGNPVMVKQKNSNGNYELINEITDSEVVKEIIEALGNANWQENIKLDIRPPDYKFTWNSYEHHVWLNENGTLELIIVGQSNYVTLSEAASEMVFEILTGKK
ncbi:hypothetical protein H8S33_06315 [Ornithinibacillus sp. BX22]|uniref:YhfM-like domain-containing protein n=1 Tax=Ornithinibacillus hominis TaxID=2763055 RepID=A0A923L4R1_9BACI|nr:hypothetical protein [Ornithinibacillus hominis]MBC5636437.1 hypothetical protein [Ornithinibacillus hominis]